MVCYSFLVRLSHPLLSAGFDRRFHGVPEIPLEVPRFFLYPLFQRKKDGADGQCLKEERAEEHSYCVIKSPTREE
jgi:hypothetical protein